MFGTIPGNTARQNFAPLRYEFPQPAHFFIVNGLHFFHTKTANPLARAAYSITLQFNFLLIVIVKTEHPLP
jgi:Zn-dependent protease